MSDAPERPFELEGVVTALNVLRVKSSDLAEIGAGLDRKLSKTPAVFRGAPVVIDMSAFETASESGTITIAPHFPLQALVEMLRNKSLVPVGVRGMSPALRKEAAESGLGVIELDPTPGRAAIRKQRPREETQPASAPPPAAAAPAPAPTEMQFALTLTQPLRSGQVVYAEGRDAVALNAVNAGAELMADGNIHVYGPLRGRALAGARGSEDARIFCQKLEADLISIAGVYLSNDALPKDKVGKPVLVSLRGGELVLSDLSTR